MLEEIPKFENLCSVCHKNPISANGKCGHCLEKEFNKDSDYLEYEDEFDNNIPQPRNKNGEVITPPRQTINRTRAIRHIEKLKKTK